MRGLPLLIIAGFVITILVLWATSPTTEGFNETTNNLQDRANPLAALTNPLQNPAAPIGLSETAANQLRATTMAALNFPTPTTSSDGTVELTPPLNPNSVRIDSANDYLGKVKMCFDKGKGTNPFADSAFAADCGMCMSSGKVILKNTAGDNITFSGPTGVYVDKADKKKFLDKQKEKGLPFPNAIPSLDAADCAGTGTGEPVLAITDKDYKRFMNRERCMKKHKIGESCALCLQSNKFTFIEEDGSFKQRTLAFFGIGSFTVAIDGTPITGALTLNPTAGTRVPLGNQLREGAKLTLTVTQTEQFKSPEIAGALLSESPNGQPYKLDIANFILKDMKTGSTPRKTRPQMVQDVRMVLQRMTTSEKLPATFDPNYRMTFTLEGILPLTFVESDQIASYDCPTSPLASVEETVDLLGSDPCLKKGQGPGTWSNDCLRRILLDSGCTAGGDWYRTLELPGNLRNNSLEKIKEYIVEERRRLLNKDVEFTRKCTGRDISTPCDTFLNNPVAVPDRACMAYLYENRGSLNPRVGETYKGVNRAKTSMDGGRRVFCRMEGSFHPRTETGLAALQQAADKYKGKTGIEAVKLYLTDLFTKATSNLDVNKPDNQGGSADSYQRCIGMKIAPETKPSDRVATNSQNQVKDKPNTNCIVQIPSYRPGSQVSIPPFVISSNYRLSFTIRVNSIMHGRWANLFRFSKEEVTPQKRNDAVWGTRTPAFWFWPSSLTLHMRIGDSRDANWGIDVPGVRLFLPTQVTLTCSGRDVIATVGNQTRRVAQPTTRYSGPATFFARDLLYPGANATITDFCFTNL